MKAVPFLNVKLKGKVSAHYKGIPVFGTDVDLNLVLTEDNVAQVIDQAAPLIMTLAAQVGEVLGEALAQKIAEVQAKQEDANPLSQIFRRLRDQAGPQEK